MPKKYKLTFYPKGTNKKIVRTVSGYSKEQALRRGFKRIEKEFGKSDRKIEVDVKYLGEINKKISMGDALKVKGVGFDNEFLHKGDYLYQIGGGMFTQQQMIEARERYVKFYGGKR
jgi:hypothetical protein